MNIDQCEQQNARSGSCTRHNGHRAGVLVISRALGRAVGSYEDDMTETRFPTHVPGNVPGTKVQEHGWEIACASMSSDIWSRECAGGWRAMARTPVCDCVRVRVLNVRVRVLGMRERVLGMRERVRGYTRACPPSCANRCPGCGGHMVGVLRGCAVEHFPQHMPVSTLPGLLYWRRRSAS